MQASERDFKSFPCMYLKNVLYLKNILDNFKEFAFKRNTPESASCVKIKMKDHARKSIHYF